VTHSMNRRYFFFGCFALAASCSRTRSERAVYVTIARAPNYSVELESLIRQILVEHRVPVRGKSVLLKPNLVEFSAGAPINTNPVFVAAVAGAFRSLGASRVHIAEGPGHRRMTLDMASTAGYFEAVPNFERNFTDLNLDSVRRVQISNPFSTLSHLYLPTTVLKCDLLVSLPKMKTHHWTGATLAMKNLFGVVPGGVYGWPKNVLHWAGIDECIADLHGLFPRQFCIVDGIEGMEGNGPILGTGVNSGVIVAGPHPPSVDRTCCEIMKIDPSQVRCLQLANSRSNTERTEIKQIGERATTVERSFRLIEDLKHFRLQERS